MDKRIVKVHDLLRGAHELVNSTNEGKYADVIYLKEYIDHAYVILSSYVKENRDAKE